MNKCELCGRDSQVLTFHHLIPRCLHSNKWFKKRYTREQLSQGIMICKDDCHKMIHKFISEKELGRSFNTLEKLKRHQKVKKYIRWISVR